MMEKSAKSSSSKAVAQELLNQVFASRLSSRNQKLPAKKGPSTCQRAESDSSGDLSDINDAEVVGYLNNKEEFLLKAITWELMNRKQGGQKTQATDKKKTAVAKKITKTTTERTTKTENVKKRSSKINYDAIEKLFGSEDEEIGKKAKLDSPEASHDHNTDSEQNLNRAPSEPQGSEKYCYGEDMYGDEEYYGGLDVENEYEGDDYGYDYYNGDFEDEGF